MDKQTRKTWAQLEAEGVKRCAVSFVGGKRCNHRAVEGSSWCEKHQPYMNAVATEHNRLIKLAAK